MNKLINLEFKRTSISKYTVATIFVTVMLITMSYFFAMVSKMKPEDALTNSFLASTEFVFTMIHLLGLASFSILSSVIFSKFVVESYHSENVQLLMLYPVSRIKVFITKAVVCVTLTLVYALMSQIIVYMVFSITESIFPILTKTDSLFVLFVGQLPKILEVAVSSTLVGILSMVIGFALKSIPATIIAAIIISAILCNIQTVGNGSVSIVVMAIMAMISLGLLILTAWKIDRLELRAV